MNTFTYLPELVAVTYHSNKSKNSHAYGQYGWHIEKYTLIMWPLYIQKQTIDNRHIITYLHLRWRNHTTVFWTRCQLTWYIFHRQYLILILCHTCSILQIFEREKNVCVLTIVKHSVLLMRKYLEREKDIKKKSLVRGCHRKGDGISK